MDDIWYSGYGFARGSGRCLLNLPPQQMSSGDWRENNFKTKQEAQEYYDDCIKRHAKSMLYRIALAPTSTTFKRFQAAGLKDVLDVIMHADSVYKSL